mmetsp:Transcript_9805/g.16512  ORF Transcript_9805/g.16512 Transcript_9805/m.16512 type:complete len:231 (-) Transcript_9805:893-1585(-)
MEDVDDLVEELEALLLQHLLDEDVVLQLDHAEDHVDAVAGDHDLERPIAGGHVVADDERAQLPKAHLEELADSKDGLLELNGLQLVLGLKVDLVVREDGRVGLLEGVVGELLDDADHLGDGQDDDLVGVAREHERADAHDYAGEDGRLELQLRVLDRVARHVVARIGNQVLALGDGAAAALEGLVGHQLHLHHSQRAVLVGDSESRAVRVLLPEDLLLTLLDRAVLSVAL